MPGFAAKLSQQEIEELKKFIPAGPIFTMDQDTRMFLASQERARQQQKE